MAGRIRCRSWAGLLLAVVITACGEAAPSGTSGGTGDGPARWSLSSEPLLEIGVVTGDASLQFSRVVGSVRLGDGRIVVLDADSREVRFFSPDGTHAFSVGRRGAGPGEFRLPTRLWRDAGDTLRVFDFASERFSFFAADGTFLRTEATVEASATPDTSASADPFRMDEWVFGWNWIDSPLPPEERGGIVAALAAMPPADPAGPMRRVRVTDEGLLWVQTPGRATEWHIHHPDGHLLGTLDMPASFTPHTIDDGFVVGVYTDALDVNFVRVYALERPGDSAQPPGLNALRGRGPATYPKLPEATLPEIRAALRNLASRQEMHYSNHYTYAAELDSLNVPAEQMPADVQTKIVSADERGWMAVFLHRPSGAMCVMAMGGVAPPGWSGGRVICPGV